LKGLPAAVCAGVSIWCSLGTVGFIEGTSTNSRVALIAPWWALPIAVAAVFGAIRVLRLSSREQAPLFGATLVILPWLPWPIPPAILLWTGPFVFAVWATVIVGIVIERARYKPSSWFSSPRRAPVVAGLLALALYGFSAVWLAPILPDGDEPHYLILAQSLIKDGDLRIENNHRRGDYLEYSLNAATPDYLRRGVNGEIYSIHAPGLPVLIAPATWLFGYRGVVAFLGLVAAASTALVWILAQRTTGSAASAWFGWACCSLTAPFLFQATEVFPDGIAASCLLLGTLPLWYGANREGLKPLPLPNRETYREGLTAPPLSASRFWFLSGVSLAILPWLQTRLAVLAIAAAVCVCLRMRSWRQFLTFAAVPAIGAALWFGFFVAIYGTPNPTAPYGALTQTSFWNLIRGWPGLLFDQQFGLIPNAPVYGFVCAGVVVAAARLRRWGWETLALTIPYMTAVGSYQMWWGGTSVPARLLTPVTLILGVAAARVWQNARIPASKTIGLMALIASVTISLTLLWPDHGKLLLNFRDGISLWLEWANDVVDLPKGLPSLFRDDRTRLWLKIAVWVVSMLASWLALVVANSRDSRRDPSEAANPIGSSVRLSWQSTWCVAIALMIGFTLAWRVDGAQPPTPQTAELNLLRHASPWRSAAYNFGAVRFEASERLLSTMRIETDRQRRPVTSPTLFSARDVPAGTYGLHVASDRATTGKLVVRAGSTRLPLLTLPIKAAEGHDTPVISWPAAVRSLTVEVDGERSVLTSAVELRPLGVFPSRDRIDVGPAHGSAHYDAANVLFLDDVAYPEPTGFWVAGGRTAAVIVWNRTDGSALFLRNAPVDNDITIDVDGDVQELMLGPGEERLVPFPNAKGRRPLLVRITSRNGFRPSTTDPGNTDLRYLGVWTEVR